MLIQAFENKCYRCVLQVSYLEHKTNVFIHDQIRQLAGRQETLLKVVRRRILAWFGHVTRHQMLSKVVLQGMVDGGRRRGGQRKTWLDNIKEWTGRDISTLMRITEDSQAWRGLLWKV